VSLLVLVNGPPGAGKSTIAARLVATRPLALNLDIDVVRGLLGAWLDAPSEAGQAARRIASAMTRTHLESGHDVIVPQFLGRAEFIVELETVARETDSRFVELALWLDRNSALEAFVERAAAPADAVHRDAVALVDRMEEDDPLGAMYDRYVALLDTRPDAIRIEVVRGDVDATLAAVESALV
jgi:predicted kinase